VGAPFGPCGSVAWVPVLSLSAVVGSCLLVPTAPQQHNIYASSTVIGTTGHMRGPAVEGRRHHLVAHAAAGLRPARNTEPAQLTTREGAAVHTSIYHGVSILGSGDRNPAICEPIFVRLDALPARRATYGPGQRAVNRPERSHDDCQRHGRFVTSTRSTTRCTLVAPRDVCGSTGQTRPEARTRVSSAVVRCTPDVSDSTRPGTGSVDRPWWRTVWG
jgi:hypothetical protein